jgi:hypothetical protein
MDVTPTFFMLDGTVVTGAPVSVQSEEIRYVDVKELLPERYRHQHNWGGLTLSYDGFNREMWSQFRFVEVNGGGSVDEFFTVKAESRASRLEAAWWMPEKSEAIIALGNVTDVATFATITFGDKKKRNVRMAPHATEILRFHSEKGQSAQSATIDIDGQAGSIVPTGLITSKDGSFNSVIRFYNPSSANQSNLYGTGLRLNGITPHMVLRNTTTNSILVAPQFTPLNGQSPYALPQISLAPEETREIDLALLRRVAQRRRDLGVVSVDVETVSGPGSVIGSLYATDDVKRLSYEVPLRDSGPLRTMTGSYPWKIGNDFSTLVYITNIGAESAEFVGQINYPGTHFLIDLRKLAPGETAVFDLRKIRDTQMTDSRGSKLPKDAEIGQFKWAIRSSTKGKVVLIGRAEMVNASDQISSSYSCNDPCPPYYDYWIDGLSEYVVVAESEPTAAWYRVNYDYGYSMGPFGAGANWSVDSTAASIDPTSSQATAVYGEDADVGGDVTVRANLGVQDRYGWDGLNCYFSYTENMIAETQIKVAGISNAVLVEAQEFDDGTATFYTINDCNVTCTEPGFVRLSLGCTSGLARKYRKQYWSRTNIIGPRLCIPFTVTYGNCFCNQPADCFETTLVP